MTGSIVAKRYAYALFSIGKEVGDNELDAYWRSLSDLDQALKSSPELTQVLTSPIFSFEEKSKVISKLGETLELNKTILNFCFLLAEKKRISAFSSICADFGRLLDEERGIIRGEILTAVALTKKKQQEVLQSLGEKSKSELALEFGVAPEIIGGVILKVGDKVMDASLRAQLSILKESIKRGE